MKVGVRVPCRPAPACAAARKQLTALHPSRSQASDGICASTKHTQQNPTSDHEPDVRGIAHAVDLTHDPAHGVDCNALVALLVERQDPRVKYLIWDRQIIRSYKTSPKHPKPWIPQPYGGANPHTKHMHISVWTEHENDTSPWFITEEDDMPQPTTIVDALIAPNGGTWLLQYDGGVITKNGAPFYGAYPGLPPAQRQGERRFVAIEPHNGGYLLLADDGAIYRFPKK